MKDIIILADFLGPLDGSYNSRFLYLADMLAKNNRVEIVTSDFDHDKKTYFKNDIEKHEFDIKLLHEGSYPSNVCIKRFFAHYIWGKSVKKYLKNRKTPDVIYCAIPTLKAAQVTANYCKKRKTRFIIDIQDLWPEAFQMVLNIPILSSIIFKPFVVLANSAYKQADAICAVSNTYCQRAKSVNKKVKTTTTVFLGTELATFDRFAAEKKPVVEKGDEIWLAYCGTLGSSYDLTCVFDALAILNNPNLRFVIMGDGPKRKEFEQYAKNKFIKASFYGRLPYDEMCGLLSVCDITVNPIMHMAAQSIINKHADYAASGLPVISTQESEEYRDLVEKYEMGFNCKNNDAEDVANKLNTLIENPNLRSQMGKNARRCAEERFDRKKTYEQIVALITEEI